MNNFQQQESIVELYHVGQSLLFIFTYISYLHMGPIWGF